MFKIKDLVSFAVNKNTLLMRYAAVLMAILFITAIFPRNRFNYDYEQGKPWKYENLYAPFKFTIKKLPDSLRIEKERAEQNVIPFYRLDPLAEQQAKEMFRQKIAEQFYVMRHDSGVVYKKVDSIRLVKTARAMLDTFYKRGIIVLDDQHKESKTKEINLLVDNKSSTRSLGDFYSNITNLCRLAGTSISDLGINNGQFVTATLCDVLKANIAFDKDQTQKAIDNALRDIVNTAGLVQQNELIITQGSIVSNEHYRILETLKNTYQDNQLTDLKETRLGKYKTDLGYFILTLIVIGTFVLFVQIVQPTIFYNSRQLVFVLSAIVLFLYLVRTMVIWQQVSHNKVSLYILPFCIIPIVMRNFFGMRIAHYTHFTILLLTGFIVPLGFEFLFLHFMAGMLAIILSERTYYWSQFFVTTGFIVLCYTACYTGLLLIQGVDFNTLKLEPYGWLLVNGFLTLLAYPLIPLFEKLFGFVSSITLAELSDLNRPLIKQLYERAPGTFWHSLQVSGLAEAACSEIHANAMLAKVGALYHDIGKMKNPAYFIENQKTEINPHDELKPMESARIISDHVMQGVAMAKAERLPNILIDFIRTHHGNTRIEFFYQRYLKERAADDRLDEEAFRYPGPLPYSKETAVVMMADSIDAASRSLKNPTDEDIDKLVDYIIDNKIKQNQFINCDISFKDIVAVRKVFKKQLRSIYHLRISYPDAEKK